MGGLDSQLLSGLVNREARREMTEIGRNAERLAVFDSGRGVETTSGVVMAPDLAPRREQLSDGNALALTTRDTSDHVVADLGVVRMLETEESEQNVSLIVDGLLTRAETSGGRWRTSRRGEGQGFADRQVREMFVVFGIKRKS